MSSDAFSGSYKEIILNSSLKPVLQGIGISDLESKTVAEACQFLASDTDNISGRNSPSTPLTIEAAMHVPDRKKLICSCEHNQFVHTIKLAYENHFPLILSPDIIWTVILQGFARHVESNAQELRDYFVDFKEEKKTLTVFRPYFELGNPDNDWEGIFSEFSSTIKENIGEGNHQSLVPTFTTTGLIEKTVFEVMLMNSMKEYFQYDLLLGCGIPRVVLEGTLQDWRNLKKHAEKLAKYKLEWWISLLLPVLHKFVQAYEGEVDNRFWDCIYKDYPSDCSGCPVFDNPCLSGWLTVFFPYDKHGERNDVLTPLNTIFQIYEENKIKFTKIGKMKKLWKKVTKRSLPEAQIVILSKLHPGISKTPLKISDLPTGKSYDMQLIVGFLGAVSVLINDCEYIKPRIGWGVVHNDATG